jgi:molybdate transport system permease protein
VAATLGARPVDAFVSVALPLAGPGLLAALVLSFAHTLGEFGVVLMIGGNIPGQTQVLSTLIYGHVEAMAYEQAHALAAILLVLALAMLLILFGLRRRLVRVWP